MRRRLDAFYADSQEYRAFSQVSQQGDCWQYVLQEMAARSPRPRVLEFGAGRSGFGPYLQQHKAECEYHVQDVTDRNDDWLSQYAVGRHYVDLVDVPGPFDVIFSTFVWEHVSNPRQTLKTLMNLLAPGGALIIWCPRYDLPGYCPPALRHHGKPAQLLANSRLMLRRMITRITGKPAFLIVTDPAVFHTPAWFRDSDALHLVSRFDLEAALPRDWTIQYPKQRPWRQRLTQLNVILVKPS